MLVARRACAKAILVLSDAEALVLTDPEIRKEFSKIGCTVLLPDHTVVKTCVDKGLFMGFLKQDIRFAQEYYLLDNGSDLAACATHLGYPEKCFILKPRKASGSRGLIIVDAEASRFDLLFQRDYRRHTVESLQSAFINHECLDLLAMRYYQGRDFNADVMCKDGKVIYSLVQERISPAMGAIMTAKIIVEKHINEFLRKLVHQLNITGLINVEMIHCCQTGKIHVYEINPRPSAAFAFLCYQGVDVIADLFSVFKGREVISRHFKTMMIKRVWNQLHLD